MLFIRNILNSSTSTTMVIGTIFTRRLVKATAATHVALTAVSVLFGIYGPQSTIIAQDQQLMEAAAEIMTTESSGKSKNTPDELLRSGIDALVQDMYGGQGIDPKYRFKQKNLVSLDETVSFEDAFAICKGPVEVTEAFRALKVAQPEALSSPRCVQLDKNGHDWVVTYALHQRYLGRFSIKSILVVQATVGNLTQDSHHAAVKVKRIEEQWNGIEPQGGIYWPSRRLNGLLSYAITTLLV